MNELILDFQAGHLLGDDVRAFAALRYVSAVPAGTRSGTNVPRLYGVVPRRDEPPAARARRAPEPPTRGALWLRRAEELAPPPPPPVTVPAAAPVPLLRRRVRPRVDTKTSVLSGIPKASRILW